jgi:hypothetical protein
LKDALALPGLDVNHRDDLHNTALDIALRLDVDILGEDYNRDGRYGRHGKDYTDLQDNDTLQILKCFRQDTGVDFSVALHIFIACADCRRYGETLPFLPTLLAAGADPTCGVDLVRRRCMT